MNRIANTLRTTPWSIAGGAVVWAIASEFGFPRGWLLVSIIGAIAAGRLGEYLNHNRQELRKYEALQAWADADLAAARADLRAAIDASPTPEFWMIVCHDDLGDDDDAE